ncbi:hypothetical protein HY571_00010 [Candidatus Micrarchaeota archaeon]|nr:hypothetical protein [Candidatus Micrarchaeota archaeon]
MTEEPRMLFENPAEFAEAVKKSKGKVVVLVHPFFTRENNANFRRYDKTLEKLRSRIGKIPIIVMEQRASVGSTSNRFNGEKVFYVKTMPSNPQPEDGWQKMHTALSKSNVRTLLIGGIFSTRVPSKKEEKQWATKIFEYEKTFSRPYKGGIAHDCVGITYLRLVSERKKAGYKTIRLIPNLVYPDKPRYTKRRPLTILQRKRMLKLVREARKK